MPCPAGLLLPSVASAEALPSRRQGVNLLGCVSVDGTGAGVGGEVCCHRGGWHCAICVSLQGRRPAGNDARVDTSPAEYVGAGWLFEMWLPCWEIKGLKGKACCRGTTWLSSQPPFEAGGKGSKQCHLGAQITARRVKREPWK